MKRKYPGIRKSFSGGYAELNALDFFEIADENLDEFAFIDRINLHYKVMHLYASLLKKRKYL